MNVTIETPTPAPRWRRFLRRVSIIFGIVAALLLVAYVIYGGAKHEGPGVVHKGRMPEKLVSERSERQKPVQPEAGKAKQVLFGDLHVHTTFSTDAFMRSLPLVGGEGAHPPADACDYARYCSALDF